MKSIENAEELRQIAAAINRIAARIAVEDGKPIKLEVVRAVLVEKSKQGYTEQVRNLLRRYGALKLTEVNPNDYPALLAEAEEINDAG